MASVSRSYFSLRARTGLSEDIAIDMALAGAQPKVEGNDASGYKVTLWGSASYKTTIYVVKEDGKYKVVGTSRFPGGVGLEVLDRVAANDLAGARVLLDWLREDRHLAGDDDPLSGAPFLRLWTKGKNADGTAIQTAAAAILTAAKETADVGLKVLEKAKSPASSVSEKLNIALALLNGYGNTREYEKALAVSEDLATQYPDSKLAFLIQSFDLRVLDRWQEANRIAEERLQRMPGDMDAMRALVWNAIAREDYAKARTLDQKILESGKAESLDLNSIAWHSLFTGKVENSDIELALKAAQLTQNNASILHTLGCVYAEAGKTKEARATLVQAMDSLNLDEPDENYWYAFGRLAEQYGERDAAICYYAQVTKPKMATGIPDSSYRLAQMRLQVLHSNKP